MQEQLEDMELGRAIMDPSALMYKFPYDLDPGRSKAGSGDIHSGENTVMSSIRADVGPADAKPPSLSGSAAVAVEISASDAPMLSQGFVPILPAYSHGRMSASGGRQDSINMMGGFSRASAGGNAWFGNRTVSMVDDGRSQSAYRSV